MKSGANRIYCKKIIKFYNKLRERENKLNVEFDIKLTSEEKQILIGYIPVELRNQDLYLSRSVENNEAIIKCGGYEFELSDWKPDNITKFTRSFIQRYTI